MLKAMPFFNTLRVAHLTFLFLPFRFQFILKINGRPCGRPFIRRYALELCVLWCTWEWDYIADVCHTCNEE